NQPPGIILTVQVDESFPFAFQMAFEPCTSPPPAGTPNFDARKASSFGTAAERATTPVAARDKMLNAKRLVFHYALVVNKMLGKTASGCAEIWGNDYVVSLPGAGFANTVAEQAWVIMHELGHNLNL